MRNFVFALGALTAAAVAWQWKAVDALVHPAGTPAAAAQPVTARGVRADGRIVAYPGAEVVVGTEVGGTVRSLPFQEKASVKKGDALAELDSSEQRAAVAEARARIAEHEVEIAYLARESARSQQLLASDSISAASADRSAHEAQVATARRDTALATSWRLGALLAKSRITAPISGVVLQRFAEVGETVAPGTRLVTIADLSRLRVEAEVDEYDAARISVGEDVTIMAEGYTNQSWRGKIEEIPDSATSRRLKPEDPSRPSDIRVLLVKVALLEPVPMRLGQRVELEIHGP